MVKRGKIGCMSAPSPSPEFEVLDVTLPDGRLAKAVVYGSPQAPLPAPPPAAPPSPPPAPPPLTALERFYQLRERSSVRAAYFAMGNLRAISGDIAARHGAKG